MFPTRTADTGVNTPLEEMAPSQAAKLFRLSPEERSQLSDIGEALLRRSDEIIDRLVERLSVLPEGPRFLARSRQPWKNKARLQKWLGFALRPWKHPRREPYLKHLYLYCAKRAVPVSYIAAILTCIEALCVEALAEEAEPDGQSHPGAEAGRRILAKRFAAERLALVSLYVRRTRLQERHYRASLRHWIETRADRLDSAVSLSRALAQEIDEAEAVRALARHVIETFDPEFVAINIISAEGVVETPLALVDGFPQSIEDDANMQRLRRNWQLCPAARSGKAFYAEDVSNSLMRCPYQAWPQERGSHCCVPLTNGTHVIGWMHLRRREVRAFSEEELEVLGIYGQMVGTAIRSLRLVNENHYQAVTDSLTGLQNRRHFEEALVKEALLLRRRGGCASVLLVDVDRFKLLNDAHGHDIGDGALVAAAKALKSCVRESDELARLGGDEFVVLLRDCSGENAARVAEKILHAVRALEVRTDGPDPAKLDVSIGISACPEDATSLDTVMLMADVALLRAKESGRGQCIRYDPGRDAQVLDTRGYGRAPSR